MKLVLRQCGDRFSSQNICVRRMWCQRMLHAGLMHMPIIGLSSMGIYFLIMSDILIV